MIEILNSAGDRWWSRVGTMAWQVAVLACVVPMAAGVASAKAGESVGPGYALTFDGSHDFVGRSQTFEVVAAAP